MYCDIGDKAKIWAETACWSPRWTEGASNGLCETLLCVWLGGRKQASSVVWLCLAQRPAFRQKKALDIDIAAQKCSHPLNLFTVGHFTLLIGILCHMLGVQENM